MSTYTQLVRRKLEVEKVPRGAQPVFEAHLEEHERIVGVDHHFERDYASRKTVDHVAYVWVEVRL